METLFQVDMSYLWKQTVRCFIRPVRLLVSGIMLFVPSILSFGCSVELEGLLLRSRFTVFITCMRMHARWLLSHAPLTGSTARYIYIMGHY